MSVVDHITAANSIVGKRSARPISVVWARVLILAGLLLAWELWLRLSGDTIVIAPPSAIRPPIWPAPCPSSTPERTRREPPPGATH